MEATAKMTHGVCCMDTGPSMDTQSRSSRHPPALRQRGEALLHPQDLRPPHRRQARTSATTPSPVTTKKRQDLLPPHRGHERGHQQLRRLRLQLKTSRHDRADRQRHRLRLQPENNSGPSCSTQIERLGRRNCRAAAAAAAAAAAPPARP